MKWGARSGLILLTGLNLLNYFDRYIVSAVLPTLKSSAGLSLTGTQAGWLASSFMIVYTVAAPLFGVLGDRGSRLRVIAVGVALWSVATALGGLATSFATLVVARALVGVGEAAYSPQAPPMLSDWFPKSLRGRIFAVFYAAFPIGAAMGVMFGSYIDAHLNWRVAFFLAGAPGLFLSALVLKLRPAPSGINDADLGATVTGPFRQALWDGLAKNPTYVITVLGYAAYSAVFGAFLFWMPSFLVSMHGLPNEVAGFRFGVIVALAGIVGTFAGGGWGDVLFRKNKQAYLWVSAGTTLLAAAVLVVALGAGDSTLSLGAVAVFAFLLYMVTAPINSALVNAIRPAIRASGLAINVFTIHALGDAWSPLIVGHLSDTTRSLRTAMMTVLPAGMVVAGIAWVAAALVNRHVSSRGNP